MKKLVLLSALLIAPTFAMAMDDATDQSASTTTTKAKKEQGSGPNPFTECGIGAAIFQNVGWAAATSNVIWDLGSTAITSALSSPETCNAKKMDTAKLIIETMPELEKDIAAGEGEYITALAETTGCANGSINAGLRQSYGAVVADSSYGSKTAVERATDMYNSVRGAAIAAGCGASL